MVIGYRCGHYEVKVQEGGVMYLVETMETATSILKGDYRLVVDYDCPTCIEDKEVRDANFERHYEEQLMVGAECFS